MRMSDFNPGAIISIVDGTETNPTTSEIESLFTGQLSADRALQVIAAVRDKQMYRAIFDDVSSFLMESGALDDLPSLDHLEMLHVAQHSGPEALNSLAQDKSLPTWLRDSARARVSLDRFRDLPENALAEIAKARNWGADQLILTSLDRPGEERTTVDLSSFSLEADVFGAMGELVASSSTHRASGGPEPAIVSMKSLEAEIIQIDVEWKDLPATKATFPLFLLIGDPEQGQWLSIRLRTLEVGHFQGQLESSVVSFIQAARSLTYLLILDDRAS